MTAYTYLGELPFKSVFHPQYQFVKKWIINDNECYSITRAKDANKSILITGEGSRLSIAGFKHKTSWLPAQIFIYEVSLLHTFKTVHMP